MLVDNILPKKITVFFRSVYFFPSLVALTFVAIIWQAFFQTDAGVINYYLGQLGIAKIGWLNNQAYSKFSVMILDIWKNSGMSMLLILAGLQNVDQGLLEAASIDGANIVQRFFKIIIPVASPQIFFVLVMNVTGALRIYESIYVLTNGGPGDSSRSLVMLIAEKGFTSFDYGTASALSIMLLILIGIVTVFQFVAIIVFTYSWNDYFTTFIMINDTEKLTLPVGILSIKQPFSTGDNVVFAAVVLAILPVLIVFLIGQKWIVKSMTHVGVKG